MTTPIEICRIKEEQFNVKYKEIKEFIYTEMIEQKLCYDYYAIPYKIDGEQIYFMYHNKIKMKITKIEELKEFCSELGYKVIKDLFDEGYYFYVKHDLIYISWQYCDDIS